MKKMFIIGLFLMVMLAIGVSAADLTLSRSSLSTAETKPTGSFSVSFSVDNATQNLTGLTLSQTGLDDFKINFTIGGVVVSSFNLDVNQTKTITVNGIIPEDVNTRLSPFSGTIGISGPVSKSLALNVNAEGQLELDKVKVKVNGKSQSMDPGEDIDDVQPGDDLTFTGNIENLFSDDDDIDIEDVEIEIIIEGIDDEGDDDLEETEDVGDIDADDDESFSIDFSIPEDVDDGDYDVIIIVEGEDENGAKHSVEWELNLKVEKDKHNIELTKASVSPSKIICSRSVKVDVELKNQGRSDEDEVVVIIESIDLGIDNEDISIPEIEEGMGDDTEYDETYSFRVGDSVKAGTYPISVKVYYDTDTLSDSKSIDLVVEKCAVDEDEDEKEDVVVVVSPPSDDEDEPEIITTSVTETTEVALLDSNTYLMLLIGAIGLAAVVVIVLVVMLFSAKKRKEQI